jgi:rhodanese-related sulfurtransferase
MKMQNNKTMRRIKSHWLLLLLVGFALLSGCSQQNDKHVQSPLNTISGADLAAYFEQHSNYINSPIAPAIINAADVYSNRTQNIKVIDLRPEIEFESGHIEGAVNIPTKDLMSYFRNTLDAMAFDTIVLVCARGQTAGFATGLLRLLGYDNTFSLRFGMSSWNKAIAETGWDKSVGNELVGKLETESHPKPPKGSYPEIKTTALMPLEIAFERADTLLSKPSKTYLIDYKAITENPGKYFVINYWPEDKYLNPGHLPGAIQYTPKKALLTTTDLSTLPTDQPIAVYCFTGQHSATVVAYLKMLGYDAYSVKFGSNAFINETLKQTEKKAGHYWSDIHKNNLPLSTAVKPAADDTPVVEIKSVQGGC